MFSKTISRIAKQSHINEMQTTTELENVALFQDGNVFKKRSRITNQTQSNEMELKRSRT
jgi:hypothetical protein